MAVLLATEEHAPADGPGRGLDWLLGSVAPDDFMRANWDREPLHIARGDPSYFNPLATSDQVRDIVALAMSLTESSRARPYVELVGGEKSAGSVRLRDAVTNNRSLWQAHSRGSTILVQMAQRYWSPLARLCEAIEGQLKAPIDATLICTPAESQAFGRHFDRLNSIVIQLSGRKEWRLLGEAQPAPVQDLPALPFESLESVRDRLARWGVNDRALSLVDRTLTLEPGDLLYVPRGTYHDVWTGGEDSAHLTLAIRPVTYVDLMVGALRDYAQRNVSIRAGLMPEVDWSPASVKARLHQIALDFAHSIDPDAALDQLESAHSRVARASAEALERAAPEPLPTSTLEHVSDHRPSIVLQRGKVEFYYGDRLFRLPDRAEPALRFIAENRCFRLDELPGLTAGSALVLARRLVRANILRVIDPEQQTSTSNKEAEDECESL